MEGQLEELIRRMSIELQELRQLTHLQVAQIRGLSSYAVRRISELGSLNRDAEFRLLEEYVTKSYDEYLGNLEDNYPDLAARIDIRDSLPESERESWYRLPRTEPEPPQ